MHENVEERETGSLKVEIKSERGNIALLMPTTLLTSSVHACTVDQGGNRYPPIKLFSLHETLAETALLVDKERILHKPG